jgi:thiol-disulfide isomerase/thioredoxin
MKKLLFILSAVVLTIGLNAQELPTTTIKQLNGKPVKFNKIFKEGRVTLVSFWATWCVPCKAEIKNIKSVLPEWKEQADFDFITISIDDSRAAAMVKAYTRSQGWDWPVYLDQNSDLKRSLNFQNVPFTMIVDKNGEIVYQHTGYEEGGENEVFEEVKKHAGPKDGATDPAVGEAKDVSGEAAADDIPDTVEEAVEELTKGKDKK